MYGVKTLYRGHDMWEPRWPSYVLDSFNVTHPLAVIIQDDSEEESYWNHGDQEPREDDADCDQSKQDEESVLCKQLQVSRKLNIDCSQEK